MTVRSFRDLRVWQLGMELVEDAYSLGRLLPASERYGLVSQIQRAAVSIPSNIAEGHTRQHRGEYVQHLSIAQGSLAELDTQLEISVRLDYVSSDRTDEVCMRIDALGKQLCTLCSSIAVGIAFPVRLVILQGSGEPQQRVLQRLRNSFGIVALVEHTARRGLQYD